MNSTTLEEKKNEMAGKILRVLVAKPGSSFTCAPFAGAQTMLCSTNISSPLPPPLTGPLCMPACSLPGMSFLPFSLN